MLRLIEEGKTNTSIAATLGFSDSTVKLEIRRLLQMLRAPDRETAVRKAREYGLLPADPVVSG